MFYHPVFRSAVVFLAIVLLMVFCFDKSRQNQHTRNALYNCVYPLYAGAVVKGTQLIDTVMGVSVLSQVVALAVVLLSAVGYARWMKPRPEIPYNRLFYLCGWLFLGFGILLQIGFLVLAIRHAQA